MPSACATSEFTRLPAVLRAFAIFAAVCVVARKHRPQKLQYFRFNDSNTERYALGNTDGPAGLWIGRSLQGTAHNLRNGPNQKGANVSLVRGLVSTQVAKNLIALANRVVPAEESGEAEAASNYEVFWMNQSKFVVDVDVHMIAAVYNRIIPIIRKLYSCVSCVPCTASLRRYTAGHAGKRITLGEHSDVDAYITVAIALNPYDEYDGGVYTQELERPATREYFKIRRGDAIFHQYDLNHGVEIVWGTRYAAIVQFKDSEKSCEISASPWYLNLALEGDADAQFRYATSKAHERFGERRDMSAALRWYRKAAEQGHTRAMHELAMLYVSGLDGVPPDMDEAEILLRNASASGSSSTLYALGRLIGGMLDNQAKIPNPHQTLEAVTLFRRSAASGYSPANSVLGHIFADGHLGVEKNLTQAATHFRLAGLEEETIEELCSPVAVEAKRSNAWLQIIRSELNGVDLGDLPWRQPSSEGAGRSEL